MISWTVLGHQGRRSFYLGMPNGGSAGAPTTDRGYYGGGPAWPWMCGHPFTSGLRRDLDLEPRRGCIPKPRASAAQPWVRRPSDSQP